MATPANNQLLTDEFLTDLYHLCLENDYVFAVTMKHIKPEHLPDREFQAVHKAMHAHYKKFRKAPVPATLKQACASQKNVRHLVSDICEASVEQGSDEILDLLEQYIRQVTFQKAYKEAGELYNKYGSDAATDKMLEFSDWAANFTLKAGGFVNVVADFALTAAKNKDRHTASAQRPLVNRFYIDELDERNRGRNLRGQITCFLASTGVGKSHIARWIGKNACQIDGLNVLHFQLEGAENEIVSAYAASLVNCSAYDYETGNIGDEEIRQLEAQLEGISGTLYVKSYPKFNAHISTVDIYNGIQDFKKRFNIKPDVIIVDSMDLLTDSSGRNYSENGERMKRIGVANDLKDLATDEDVWMVVTYQSTIESQDWFDDESKVLTAHNTAEAKGISRPLSHLISLNQSSREAKENTMRLHVAKSRFFKRGDPFRIATDYDHERFYDRVRTMNINKTNPIN